jgi:peptide-methionine (S)-S-oxide reductase
MRGDREVTTLGGGCFWCLEAVFNEMEGVINVVSGYAGGHQHDPDYQSVCRGTTGHAEVVQITFDPQIIQYKVILEVFFSVHNPTTLNRQGVDEGPQYRSVIFYHSNDQKEIAKEVIKVMEIEGIWSNPIVTELNPFEKFYPAEDYHQDFFKRNPDQGYCMAVINPKMVRFRRKFIKLLRPKD